MQYLVDLLRRAYGPEAKVAADLLETQAKRIKQLEEELKALKNNEHWRYVPVEPTEAMLLAPSTLLTAYGTALVWKRMLECAPRQP